MDCVFCKIVRGELPAKKLYESERIIAFEDINKVAPVHALVIPKAHYDSFIALPDTESELIVELHRAIQEVARLIGVADTGFRLVTNNGKTAGQSVFHLHFHVIGGRTLELKMG